MKKHFLALLLCLACAAGILFMSAAAAPAPCRAETAPAASAPQAQPKTGTAQAQTVTITGSGRITAKADAAILNFGVRTSSEDLVSGVSRNAEDAKHILDVLAELGYGENCVTAEHFSAYPVCRDERQSYEICRNYELRISADAPVQSVIAKLTEAGANNFHGVRYVLDQRTQAYRDALKAAKADALEKASALQAGLELVELTECGTYWYCDNNAGQGANCIIVEANVQAVFSAKS